MNSLLRRNRTKCPNSLEEFCRQVPYDGLPNIHPQYLRPMVNLQPWLTAIEHQRHYQSCVAESVAGALEYLIKRYRGLRPDGTEYDVSRMFIIWIGNMIEKQSQEPQNNEGSWTPEAIFGVVKYGFIDELIYGYSDHTRRHQPPKRVFKEAKKCTIVPVIIPPDLYSMKKCLNYELPFIIGFNVALFYRPDMRRINNNYNGGRIQGHPGQLHAVLVVGYDDRTQLFLVRNSWGKRWGAGGYFYIPYKYMMDKRYMTYDQGGIWAISKIIPREKNALLRMKNPSGNVKNEFLPLPTDEPIDLKFWLFRRFQVQGYDEGWLNDDDFKTENEDVLVQKCADYLERHYPYRLQHLIEEDDEIKKNPMHFSCAQSTRL